MFLSSLLYAIFDGKTACAVSPGRHSVTRALQQLGDDLSKLGAADRAGVGHLRGEVLDRKSVV